MEEKEVQGAPVHKRRVRYSGTHPKRFEEKYKEQNPEKYADTVAGSTCFLPISLFVTSTAVAITAIPITAVRPPKIIRRIRSCFLLLLRFSSRRILRSSISSLYGIVLSFLLYIEL